MTVNDDPLGLELAQMGHDLGWNAARAKIMQYLVAHGVSASIVFAIGEMEPEPAKAIEAAKLMWERAGKTTQ